MYGLLAYLALTKRHFHRDTLAALFWPDHDDTHSHNSLRVVLSDIHKITNLNILPVTNELVGPLDLNRISVDIEEFQAMMAQIRQIQRSGKGDSLIKTKNSEVYPSELNRDLLQKAVSLYRGDFMSGFNLGDCRQFSDWQFQQGEHLRREFCYALKHLVDICQQNEEYEKGITLCRRFVEEDYLNEDTHRTLMRLYNEDGQKEAALHQFILCKRALQEQLGLDPEESTVDLYESIRHSRPALLETSKNVAENNLPLQLTSFIGRVNEIEDIIKLLDNSRLITLLGQGGSGKTRLSIHIASEYPDIGKDGILFIDLSSVINPDYVIVKIAEALNISSEINITIEQNVTNYLKKKTVLLLLDNCEHLITACASAANKILTNCPDVKILTTSRESLKILGETTYRISSLSIPPLGINKPDNFIHYESSQLFIDRSAMVNPSFSVTCQSTPALIQICNCLDGMPLALELAAAKTRFFSLEEIAERLTNRFSLLKSNDQNLLPRHKTLKSLIDWSYDLLTVEEKLFFVKLSIFTGGWDYAAAETICCENRMIPLGRTALFFDFINDNLPEQKGDFTIIPEDDDAEILAVLTALIDKSLVIVDESNGKSRYRMLESIREYAGKKLCEAGNETSLQAKFLDYYILKAEKIELRFYKNIKDDSILFLSPDYANIQKALSIGLENKDLVEKGMRLTGALYPFWKVRGSFREGLVWCRRFLSEPEESVDLKIRWKALFEAAMFAASSQKFKEAEEFIIENFEICKKLKSESAYALVLRAEGYSQSFTDPEGSEAIEKTCLSLMKKNDLKYWIPIVMMNLGVSSENYHEGAVLMEKSLTIARKLKHRRSIIGNLFNLGDYEIYLGNYAQGAKLLEEGLCVNNKVGDRLFRLIIFKSLGTAFRCLGNIVRAEECYLEELYISEEMGFIEDQERSLCHLGLIKSLQGYPEEAKKLLLNAYKIHTSRDFMQQDSELLLVSVKVFYAMGYNILAVIFLSALKTLRVRWLLDFSKMDRENYDSLVSLAKTMISPKEYNGAWEKGSTSNFDQLIELVLESDFSKV